MYPAHVPLQSYSSTILEVNAKKKKNFFLNVTINLVYITTMYVFIFYNIF